MVKSLPVIRRRTGCVVNILTVLRVTVGSPILWRERFPGERTPDHISEVALPSPCT